VGAENAGIFSMAMVIGTVLLFFGNYGVRTYQVSDIDEMESFYDYQVNRIITCVAMLIVGWLYCMIRGYDSQMTAIVMWVLGFRFFDALGDVYEGRLQQKDKLYLAGLSQAVRCALAFVAFTVLLLITHDLAVSSFAMTIGAAASFFLLTLPLALMETDKSLPFSVRGVKEIFVNCFPLFLAAFLYNLVDSMPKFAIEGVLSYDNQLYYNAMYFPAHAILMVAAMVYKPQLLRLASIWDDPQKHKRFDLIILAMIGVIAIITLLMGLVMAWIGIPIMSFLYGLDFEQFRPLVYVMVVNGGMCAGIDFLYQIITVLREQKVVSRIYLITFAFSIPVLYLLVSFSGLSGAVVGAVVVMGILLVLLLSEYFMIRKRLERY
jgi:O-antigen/teichoic acid export membrane protein